jgi:hypothetical protein
MAEITGMRNPSPMTPQDEHRRQLESTLTEARERIMHAQNELAMFKPIEASTMVGSVGGAGWC